MPKDAYEPCPCGSGKKFKFCCMDVADQMEKVGRHAEKGQFRMAHGVLDRLEKKFPDNPWVFTSRASILFDEEAHAEAKAVLEKLLAKHPDHPTGIALYALAALYSDGYEDSRQAIYRAIERSIRVRPDLISELALSVGLYMLSLGKYLAARRFLTLSMLLADREEARRQIFMDLLEFDGNRKVPYPLRGVHSLESYKGDKQTAQEAARAVQLANVGCVQAAAELFTRLAEDEPENACLWQNAGLCWAWTGDESQAADALHLAARLHEDRDTAVELETVAQLLDIQQSSERIARKVETYSIDSLSRLLGALREQARFVPVEVPKQQAPTWLGRPPDAMFAILDRPPLESPQWDSLTIEMVPNIVGDCILYDADPEREERALAVLQGLDEEPFHEARALFEATGGELLERTAEGEELDTGWIPAQRRILEWRWHFSPKTPPVHVQRLVREKWRQVIDEVWANRRQEALHDMSPLQAAGNPDLQVPLTAAIYVLDAECDCRRYTLDVSGLCERLQVQPLNPLPVTDETSLNLLSSMQLIRVPLADLTDEQLRLLLNRALLLRHSGFLYRVLEQAEKRPDVLDDGSLEKLYSNLSGVCHEQGRTAEALQWIAKGRQIAEAEQGAFKKKIRWELAELTVRLDNPDDPELRPVLQRIHSKCSTKLPELIPLIEELCSSAAVPVPWQTGPGGVVADGAVTSGGIWTPEAEQSGEKKLWLPGQ